MYKGAEYYGGSEDRSGKLSEYFLLGEVKTDKKTYLSWEDAVKLAKDLQKDDQVNPKRPFLRDLRNTIVEKMQFNGQKDAARLKIYTAIGTPLDRYHKTDMFVELEDDGSRASRIATGDISINEEKIENEESKADVLIGKIADPMEDKKEYNIQIDEIADKFVRALKTKPSIGGRA